VLGEAPLSVARTTAPSWAYPARDMADEESGVFLLPFC
jgi:hypothetical protein